VSVEIGIEVHLLIELGELDAVPCEHTQHQTVPAHHADGNEHYVRATSPCGHGLQDEVFVVCEKWLTTSDILRCGDCGLEFHIWEQITDLGPVSNFRK